MSALVAMVGSVASCGGSSGPKSAALRPAPAGDAAFRAPADAKLGQLANGTPIWGRAIHGPPDAVTYWLLYKSERASGRPEAVSGVISIQIG
ncbi:MAG: hypothetical protein JWL70_1107, partial [Acidimicrobiia bacterium]|nr:hypothetical protein [Acidimicrobiia bacterium]